jgi:methylated-DNA-[protein]-cysteine S-methyltransferase
MMGTEDEGDVGLEDLSFQAEGRVVKRLTFRRGGGEARADGGVLRRDIERYLGGERVTFADYEIDWSGYTAFQRAVLEATRTIPYGETRTYGEIAAAVGKPRGARAVGQALGKNRTCIVVPCHRVVGAKGLGGFSGGLRWKKRLLRLEGVSP